MRAVEDGRRRRRHRHWLRDRRTQDPHELASLRVEAHGKPGNYAGRILCESRMCDLALVTVDDDEFWESVPATHFSTETPSLDATVAGANATCALQIRAPAPASLACAHAENARPPPPPAMRSRGRGLPTRRRVGDGHARRG